MGSGTQTTVASSDPWQPAQGALQMGLRDATRAYKRGIGANTGNMVVPYSKQSMGAFESLMDMSNANSGGQGLSGNLQGIINNGGFNSQQKGALDNWQNLANSEYDFNANPGSQGVLDSIIRDTKDAANLGAAAAGRYGSGMHQGRLAQDVGDVSSQFRMNDFNTFLGRRDAANSNLFNGAQAGIGNMTSAFQGMQAPQQAALGVGSAMEDLKRRQLDERARVANLPWDQIGKLMNVGNLGGQYKTTTATSPGPNPFLQALGMGATAGNLMFGAPAMSGGLTGLF